MGYEIGSGSWYSNISFNDFREHVSIEEFRGFCYEQCKKRFLNQGVKVGDCIRVTFIGGQKARRYTGILTSISGDPMMGYYINLQQKKMDKLIGTHWIDKVELLNNEPLLEMKA